MASPGKPATVQEWLQSLHLEQFVNDFLFWGYNDLSKCCKITKADLVRLGITQVGYQKRILSRLPCEAGAVAKDTSGQDAVSNGNIQSQPVPSPRRAKLAKGPPSIDNTDYISVNISNRKSCSSAMISDMNIGNSVPVAPSDSLDPSVPKPVPKPRSNTVRKEMAPPLPERGKPIPQPRPPPPPPIEPLVPTLVPPSSIDRVFPENPAAEAKERPLSISTNPFSNAVDDEELPVVDPQINQLFHNPFNPFNDMGNLAARPVPPPPVPRPENISTPKTSHDGPSELDLSRRPVPVPPPVEVDTMLNRPVPEPPALPGSLTSAPSSQPPLPPPLPAKGRPPRSKSVPEGLADFLQTRGPPPPPPPRTIEEEKPQLPELPPRPAVISNSSPTKSESMHSNMNSSNGNFPNLVDNSVSSTELNGNEIKSMQDFPLIDNLMQPMMPSDISSNPADSVRKSDQSSISSQDDTPMGLPSTWSESMVRRDSDLFPEISGNPLGTISSVTSTGSDKIMTILDGYSPPDITVTMSSQESILSPDASIYQDDSQEDAVDHDEEGIYDQLWDQETRPKSQAVVPNIFKNPPPLPEISDDPCYLPLTECNTGHPRPPSSVMDDLPQEPPPPPLPRSHLPLTPQNSINPPGMLEHSPDPPPPVPMRRAPAPPIPYRADSAKTDPSREESSKVKEGVLVELDAVHMQLGADHMQEMNDGYDLLEPAMSTTPGQCNLDDRVIVIEDNITEILSSDESDTEVDISVPDGAGSDSGISAGNDDPFPRSNVVYASLKPSKRPHQRVVPEEARRRLSMRLSTSQARGLIPNKLEKSGYLWKCGAGKHGKGGFRKRWFVFNGKELRYYESEKNMASCKGIVPVGTMLDVKHFHRTSIVDRYPTRIELMTNARTYFFATDSCDEGTIWANMLMQAIIGYEAQPGGFPKGGEMSCPDKQGHLKMEGCNQRRYFAIKGEKMCYYSSEKDFEAAVPISDIEMKLANARINMQKPERITLTTPSTTYHLTAESPEEAREWVEAMMEAVSEGLSDKLYLHKVWENDANRLCADCNMSDPDWCSLNFGIVVCKKCSGIHRQLGVHVSKVRSLKMDVKAFTDTALEVFLAVGNELSNAFWERNLDPHLPVKPMPDDSIDQRKMFITHKYVDRQYSEHILLDREVLNKELQRAVAEGNVRDCLKYIFSGANVHAVNERGQTVKDLAVGHSNSPVIKELLEQNKDYSNHQQELMSRGDQLLQRPQPQQPQPATRIPDGGSPTFTARPTPSQDRGLEDSGRGSPTTSHGSPHMPVRPAPLPPVLKSPTTKQDEFTSSKGSIQEQIRKAGYLYKTGSNRKDFLKRYCLLEHGTFTYYQDERTTTAKNLIEGTDMVFVSVVPPKHGHDYCFEIGTVLGRMFLFAAEDAADRRNWMLALNKFHTPECMWSASEDYEYAGFLRKKIGRAATTWQRLWFLLKGKMLSFYSAEKDGMEIIDLRKTKEISQEMEEESSEQVKDIAIVVPGRTIYLRADTQQISDAWMSALQKNAMQTGAELEEQLLTEDHIPYIVKECINFVYMHQGLEQEGIYRLSGTASKIQRVREMFRVNPRSVQINRAEFEVNDVAGALKKYFRELPNPVFTKEWYSKWIEVSDYTDHSVKLQWYKYLLGELPKVHYHTIKTVIAHLIRVRENDVVNKMTDKNLASVFGPTLMALPDSTFGSAEKEISVIGDMMMYYQWLFDISEQDWEAESRAVKQVIKIGKIIREGANPKNETAANGFVMSFYIRNKNEGNAISVPLTDKTTAKEVVDRVVERHRLPSLDGKAWGLFEVVENGELERMMFDYEVVLSEVQAWDSTSAPNNYLCIKQNSLLQSMEVFLKNMAPSATIKYADGPKKFKDYYFEISGSTMRYCRSGGGAPINYWEIMPLKIYLGASKKHKKTAPTRWAISFQVPGDKELKCLCFDSDSVRTMWLAGLFRCKMSGAAAYASNLRLSETARPVFSAVESASIRERTSSFGEILRENARSKFPFSSLRGRQTPSPSDR
ncbi:arf-GAP with Rho-GAP domain, ANK repeat and PH domain-containing protein 1-like [Diadema antillarum]|uniref:arf-GAP with Rho-GAP domain, ANK repeat and PH domain-containing protein 1-like n=1 Tax=Diadema antillarum TaxID=105358 RepID=UPI003A8A1FFC